MELVTLLMALAFAAVHVKVGALRFLQAEPRSASLSFAGGVAVSYVFLHILPELAAHADVLANSMRLGEFGAEETVYTLSLTGLVAFYGAERALRRGKADGVAGGSVGRAETGDFWIHIGLSALLVFIVAYLLNERDDASIPGLALYFAAMTLHFVTADFGSRHDHPELYDTKGRWVLAASTLAGWGAGLAFELPEAGVACLFAFIAGAIMLTVLKEELPAERESRFVPFAFGAATYAALVLGERAIAG